MNKIIALIVMLLALPAHAQTIDNLGAGAPLTGAEKVPIFQGANPAVRTTTQAIANLGFPLITGNVDVYANPSTGVDTNTCLAASGSAPIGPCATIQHAIYILTQTARYGIRIGTATLHLADGTYNEVVDFPGTVGLPRPDLRYNRRQRRQY